MLKRLLFNLLFLATSIAAFLLASLAVSHKNGFQNQENKTGAIRIISENNLFLTKSPSFNFAHISDTHCPNRSLKKSLHKIMDLNPDFIAHTGDMVHDNTPKAFMSYIDAADSISGANIFHAAGNRDTNSGKDDESYFRFLGLSQYFVDVNKDWRFVFLRSDSLKIKSDDMNWLKKVLQEGKQQHRRVLLFTHCPPYNLIFRMIEYHCLKQDNSDELAQALKGYDVAGIFCGHIHLSGAFDWENIPVYYTNFLTGYNSITIDGRSITVKQLFFP